MSTKSVDNQGQDQDDDKHFYKNNKKIGPKILKQIKAEIKILRKNSMFLVLVQL